MGLQAAIACFEPWEPDEAFGAYLDHNGADLDHNEKT